ncbi:MAG: RluA family pseudouridine synthase [Lachnospiraceae bacterium]|nr:RluA family pseudouridine synthase [Lachnospiraceae bacterium]
MQKYVFQVSEEDEGERVDRYLSILTESLSRSYLQKLLKDGLVLLEADTGNFRVLRASYKVMSGDRIHLSIPDAVIPPIEAEEIPLDILYEDEHLLVVNKPKGMVVHPAPGHYQKTLVNALLYHCRDSLSGINGVLRPGIVHRIDRDTTGSIIVCKNDFAHQEIAKQLQEKTAARKYVAIVCGVIANDCGTVDAPIGRHPKERKKMAVLPENDTSGKNAVTNYRVLQRFHKYTYIECELETGRTHQIRVHMAYLKFPILGDGIYGNAKAPFKLTGQTLHAKTIGFIHPISKKEILIEAPIPDYFLKLLRILDEKQ